MSGKKKKNTIFSDPIYGFITMPDSLILKLIDHTWFQRLRRIKQLGLTHLVYPGAHHTRFHHAIGAMHLVGKAVEILRSKGHNITDDEALGVKIAILLHDIGHGPYSHTLEHSIVKGISHEDISVLMMRHLNREFDGALSLAIKIFTDRYKKRFLHHLVSSQLDMDRLDYLMRDGFFSGVAEGEISSDRIIETLNVVGDELAIEAKGIYSVESFIIARRLMYWQVYLHKTVISAEHLLINILSRAKELASEGVDMFCTPGLRYFLYGQYTKKMFRDNKEVLQRFASLDDYDVMASVKVWMEHPDPVLSRLSGWLVKRNLYKIEMREKPFSIRETEQLQQSVSAEAEQG
ncbi:MAG: HD domain-containing protein, partial [Flavobacteriales bacterium]